MRTLLCGMPIQIHKYKYMSTKIAYELYNLYYTIFMKYSSLTTLELRHH